MKTGTCCKHRKMTKEEMNCPACKRARIRELRREIAGMEGSREDKKTQNRIV